MREEIWKNAIKCFKEMRSPFDTNELSKMKVTLTECGELSENIANAMELLSFVQKDPVLLSSIVIAMEWKNADFDRLYTFLSNHKKSHDLLERLSKSKVG